MSFTTDPAPRQAFITGLRDLADYLDQHPDFPVPENRTDIYLAAQLIDHGGRTQVDCFARQLGVTATDNRALTGHYETGRFFGPIGYRMISLSAARMTVYQADAELNGLPDTWT